MPVLKNPKHEIFAQSRAAGATLIEAYAKAGFKPSATNAERLNKVEGVKSRIEEIQAKAAEKAGITIEKIQDELVKIAEHDIRKAVKWGTIVVTDEETGEKSVMYDVSLISSDEIDDRTAAAISEVRKTKDGISIKFHDKQAALVSLGRHLGMFKDKVEHSGEVAQAVRFIVEDAPK